ncbi:MAG TPA: hypothetical protein VJ735_06190 [Actinomycetes bacterium]|nr:hypothetical protein [Actinomycetes bacterium]
MRTSWMLSRPSVSATRNPRVEAGMPGRRARRAWLLAGLVVSLVLGLTGCGAGGGDNSATGPTTERSGTRTTTERSGTGPTTERSGTRTEPSGTESPSEPTTQPTQPPRTTADAPTSTRPPTSAERPSSQTTAPATSAEAPTPTSAPTTSAAGTPAAAESEGLGALGWILLLLLVVALAAGWLVWRSRRRSAWDAQTAALEEDTRTATGTRLPPVLTAEDAGQRALSWPPLRAELVDLMRRWDLLAERAPDDQRRNRTGQVRNLLQELVAAVDAENEALATGRDWRLLRPRVDQAERALSAVLAGVPQPEPPAGGEPWPPAPGG